VQLEVFETWLIVTEICCILENEYISERERFKFSVPFHVSDIYNSQI
jgi:hypothetical protein